MNLLTFGAFSAARRFLSTLLGAPDSGISAHTRPGDAGRSRPATMLRGRLAANSIPSCKRREQKGFFLRRSKYHPWKSQICDCRAKDLQAQVQEPGASATIWTDQAESMCALCKNSYLRVGISNTAFPPSRLRIDGWRLPQTAGDSMEAPGRWPWPPGKLNLVKSCQVQHAHQCSTFRRLPSYVAIDSVAIVIFVNVHANRTARRLQQ